MVAILPNLVFLCIALVLPLGVAGQHIGLGLGLAIFIYSCFLDRGSALAASLRDSKIRTFFVFWILIVLPILMTTITAAEPKEASRLFWGYLYGACIPVMGVTYASVAIKDSVHRFFKFILILFAIIAISQVLGEWKFESGKVVSSMARAQGFYSHPLTFAYATLVVMPWAFSSPMTATQKVLGIGVALAVIAIVLTSQSVTVIAISSVIALLAIIFLAKKTFQVAALAVLTVVFTVVATTDNSVNRKVNSVLSGERGDHETSYPDDRMAFWHAHWEMFKAAPVLGHGSGLEKEDRMPYYEKIGLGQIERMYEAHNMYLQFAVEGGIIPPLALLGLLVWLARLAMTASEITRQERFWFFSTPVALALGGLTQNAFQDSEVRFAFLVFIAVMFWRLSQKSQKTI